MKRPYVWLFAGILVLGVALGAMSKLPRRDAPRPASVVPVPKAEVSLQLVSDGALLPERSAVPKGSDVTLTVVNRGASARTIALSGYEEHVHLAVPPGASGSVTFRADHPGDDFAWLVDGVPAGRLAVTGSHLVEGHQ